jgi:hypothetical protein
MQDEPPQQLPPPGWFPDPNGQGLRWWDGRAWTEHVSPPAGAAAPAGPGEFPPERRRFRLWVGAAMIAVAAALGALALTMGDDGDEKDSGSPPSTGQPASSPPLVAAECESIAQSVVVSLPMVEHAASSGREFEAQLALVRRQYERLGDGELASRCGAAGEPLEDAITAYLEATEGDRSAVERAKEAVAEAQAELAARGSPAE